MSASPSKRIGLLGEDLAAQFLERRRIRVVKRNAFVDRHEIDIIYRVASGLVAVEVKSVTGNVNPFEAITDEKMRRLRVAISGYGERFVAIDAIGVNFQPGGVTVRWLRGID